LRCKGFVSSGWPPLQRIEKAELPPLPLDHIPEVLRRIVFGVAAAAQVDPALVFTVVIATLSAATAGGAIASPTPAWTKEPISVWTIGVADPSERKTAVYSQITPSLRNAALYVADRDAEKKAVIEAELLLAKEQHKKALRSDDAPALSDAVQRVAAAEADLASHAVPNFLVQDPTPEALEQLMERQTGVAFVTSDEGTFIENLAGRYSGNAPVLGMVNSAWSGQPIRSIRVSRGDTSIDHPFLPIAALIQPEVATKLSDRAFVGTGFVSRILAVYPNPRAGNRPLDEAVPLDLATIAQWDELLRETLSKYWRQNRDPVRITFDLQAQEVLRDYQRGTDRNCARRELGGMSTWWGKAHGHAVRMAALFSIANGRESVDGDTMRDAVVITDWYAEHMAHLFDVAIEADADLGDQGRILRWIERHHERIVGNGGTFTTRDLQRDLAKKGRSIERKEDLDAPLGALQQRGYLREFQIGGGRAVWQVCPELLHH
jgi:hypothetical protein